MRTLFISASRRLGGLVLLLLTVCCSLLTAQTRDYTRWVNPFIGTGGHGHTFPGATMPFGMVQLSPDTRIDNWDGSSGYHYSDDIIYGFSHTHLSGTGIPDGCDILFMPTVGEPRLFAKEGDKSVNGYASKFSHQNERAEPGYYSVKLDDDNIFAEMTATTRVGFHRYTFPQSDKSAINLDISWRDKKTEGEINLVGEQRIEGFRRSTSWAKDQVVYFVADFSKPIKEISGNGGGHTGDDNARIPYTTRRDEQILIKVAISSVSIEGARKNLEAELPGWDFDKVRADARAAWNKELSKIEVSGGTDEQTTNFYTALYHTMIHPNVFNDVDGNYLGHDRKIHNICDPKTGSSKLKTENCREKSTSSELSVTSSQYSVFSLWDTFRAAHPLYTIIDQKRTVDFINTFIRQYEQGGRLPVWELWGEETDTMIGYHSVSVIADAMAKGIKGFDYEKAFIAAKHSANLDHHGLAAYKKRGYISSEDENESVSKTLEYAYNDYCIATMAQSLMRENLNDLSKAGRERHDRLEKEASEYFTRSLYYRNLFDPETGFMRPRRNGGFISPFEPNEVTFHFTEGNSWQYSFFAPHDVSALAELHRGKINFAKKLDELFTTEQKLSGRFQPDITGLIGQYAHGNEPSHHIGYLYNYVNQPWKTQSYIRRILDEFYKNAPDGLIGNEDAGQMSAWYVMSALGFYQVNPSRAVYDIGTPLFREARINLENGKVFTIRATNVSPQNRYVKSVKLNGKPYRRTQFQHRELMNGGTLEFEMTNEPVKDWFEEFSNSEVGGAFVPSPVIIAQRTFHSVSEVSIRPTMPDSKLFYSTDGSDPKVEYTKPFTVDKTTIVKAVSVDDRGRRSFAVEANLLKRPNDWTVKIVSPYSNQYPGGGDDAIIDGLRGNTNFAAGEWQGFQGKTFEAVIDLQRETEIKYVGGSFLQSARSWIWMPVNFKFEISNNGSEWSEIADIKTDVPPTEMNPVVKEFRKNISPTKARYVRVRAFNFGNIPSWHLGAGGDPWIFVDEIFID
jgi:predicted alpha-1,2-mannosidase